MTSRFRLLLILFFLPLFAFSAAKDSLWTSPPWRIPINGNPSITGAFGSIRPNHFHSGLDFSTFQRTGIPVCAAADGWVSRIRHMHNGYGKAVYITHENGLTTLYAHLEEFSPGIYSELRRQQLMSKNNEIDFKLGMNLIKVKSGDTIGLSGNTGNSYGPHLHFEVRTASEVVLNPFTEGFHTEDRHVPQIKQIAFYLMDSSNVIRKIYDVQLEKGKYTIKEEIKVPIGKKIGVALSYQDIVNAHYHSAAIFKLETFVDDTLQYRAVMDSIYFENTRAVNSCIDYSYYATTKTKLHKCFKDPGNQSSLIKFTRNNGFFTLEEGKNHLLKCILTDFSGNTASIEVNFSVDSIRTESHKKVSVKKKSNIVEFKWNTENLFFGNNIQIQLPLNALYRNTYFEYKHKPKKEKNRSFSDSYQVGTKMVPLNSAFTIKIKPKEPVEAQLREKVVMVETSGLVYDTRFDEDGFFKSEVRTFGHFTLKMDSIPPKVISHHFSNKSLKFIVKDDFSGLNSYHVLIDGIWTPAEYDYKTKTVLVNLVQQKVDVGKHIVEIILKDRVHNRSSFSEFFEIK